MKTQWNPLHFPKRTPHPPERAIGKPRGPLPTSLPPRLRPTLRALLQLPPVTEVLDAAAGNGHLMAELAKAWPHTRCTASDLSPAWPKQAAELFTREGVAERCLYVLHDLEHPWSLPSESYGGVVCAFALHHFQKPEMVLENLYHAVRPGGWLYLVDFKRVPYLSALPWGGRFTESLRASYRPDELTDLLKSARLPSVKIHTSWVSYHQAALIQKPARDGLQP